MEKRLDRHRAKATVTVVPTWECNLRCTHCTVLNRLVRKDEVGFDLDGTADFLRRFRDYSNYLDVYVCFVGGEALLHPEVMHGLVDRLGSGFSYGVTTNLSSPLGEIELTALKRMDNITVSLDGTAGEHNAQRKALDSCVDPFEKTYENLKVLVRSGLRDRLTVQAAMRDEFLTSEIQRGFFKALLKIGVPFRAIQFKCLHPTERDSQGGHAFRSFLASGQPVTDLCCKYRPDNLVVERGNVVSDYYTWDRLGSIYDSVASLMDAHRQLVRRTLSFYSDPTCRSCPVVGCCWGGCTNGTPLTQGRPSEHCDRLGLIARVQELAETGRLIPIYRKGES